MRCESPRPTVIADDVGIHFLPDEDDVVVAWGEIAGISGLRLERADGTPFLTVYIHHITGVNFALLSNEVGYEQAIAEMEKHLIGFRSMALEAVRPFSEVGTVAGIWDRNEAVQPFQLRPPVIDPREPTAEERAEMEAARQASIAACEAILGRPLKADELKCVEIGFENGEITGGIAAPLCRLLVERQSEAS